MKERELQYYNNCFYFSSENSFYYSSVLTANILSKTRNGFRPFFQVGEMSIQAKQINSILFKEFQSEGMPCF